MDALVVYNSLTRKKEAFEPINPPFVGMYVCGPTVYGNAHLGHARSALSFDIVYRYLKELGYKVRYVRNITDVGHLVNDADEGESKIEQRARLEQLEPMEVAQQYYNSYIRDMNVLNMLRPDIEPRATGHIPEQIEMVESILKNGYAYESNGSVYFDVEKYNQDFKYGKLSGRDLDQILSGSRDDLEGTQEKRHSADFALWKKASPTHIMRWNSPWSIGFPGWHLECTVMSTKYLGQKYDIHGGGMDLLFPHHEAEIAQSNACNCDLEAHQQDEARYWLHNNMITYQDQKMGKSLGNAIDLDSFYIGEHWTEPKSGLKLPEGLPSREVEKEGKTVTEYNLLMQPYSGMVLRFFILQAHYRSTVDFSNTALQASEKAFQRLNEGLKRLDQVEPTSAGHIDESFEANLSTFMTDAKACMNDDFNTARVIARMFEALPVINHLHKEKSKGFPVKAETFIQFRKDIHSVYSDWLGMINEAESGSGELVEGLMEVLLKIRDTARVEKNWAVSDLIRNKLTSLQIKLEDSVEGTDWYYEN